MRSIDMVILGIVPGAALLSLVGAFLVRSMAQKLGWYDEVGNPRKIHKGKIPRLGGVAIFWAFALSLLFVAMSMGMRNGESATLSYALPLIGALGLAHFTGLVDDFRNIRARVKLLCQIAVAIIILAAGFRFRTLPLPHASLEFGVFSYPLTFLWIVGIMNAVNMIDGMDGLAAGLSVIAAFTYGIIYSATGLVFPALVSFAVAGAALGFLFLNYPPATIFMGDSGSLFLGAALAVMPLLHRGSFPAEAGFLPGITLLIIPILDVFAAIWRRSRRHVGIMTPDKEHLHHKLLSLGLDTKAALLTVYGVQLALSCLVVSRFIMPYPVFFSLTILAWCFVGCGFVWLHYATSPRARWEEFAKRREAELAKANQEEDELERTGTWFGRRK